MAAVAAEEGGSSERAFKDLLSKVGGEYHRLCATNRRLLAEVSTLRGRGGGSTRSQGQQSQQARAAPSEATSAAEERLDRVASSAGYDFLGVSSSAHRPLPPPLDDAYSGQCGRHPPPVGAACQGVHFSAQELSPVQPGGRRPSMVTLNTDQSWVPFQAHSQARLPIVAAPSPKSIVRVDSTSSIGTTISKSIGARFSWRAGKRDTASQRGSQRTSNGRLTLDAALAVASFKMQRKDIMIINPSSSEFLSYWDRVTAIALAFVVFVTPVHVAMYDDKVDGMFVANCAVDIVFLVDMVLQFFIMYPKDIRYGHALEHRPRKVAFHYLRSWFPIDLISTIPFDAISLLTPWNPVGNIKAVKAVRVLRLMKLTRVMRAPRMVNRFQFRMSITYKKLSLVQFFVMMAIVTHWLTAMWALTLALVDPSEGLPRWIDDIDAVLDEKVANKTKDTKWKLYLTCLYFTTYTLTSVGYGDIGPKNILERIVCTIMIIISGTSWAVVLGQVSGIVSNLKPDEQTFRSDMDDLQFMMTDQMVPSDMRQRIICFFKSNKAAQRRMRHHHLIQAMSPGLRGEVMTLLNAEWMTKVGLLNTIWQAAESNNSLLLRNFIYDVSTSMEMQARAQAELFGAPHILYILNRGLVARGYRISRSGSVWGVDFLLANPALLEPVESLAMTYVEVTTVTRDDFFQLVEKHRVGCPELKRHVRYAVRWLALQRAINHQAKVETRLKARTPGRSRAPSAVSAISYDQEDAEDCAALTSYDQVAAAADDETLHSL